MVWWYEWKWIQDRWIIIKCREHTDRKWVARAAQSSDRHSRRTHLQVHRGVSAGTWLWESVERRSVSHALINCSALWGWGSFQRVQSANCRSSTVSKASVREPWDAADWCWEVQLWATKEHHGESQPEREGIQIFNYSDFRSKDFAQPKVFN